MHFRKQSKNLIFVARNIAKRYARICSRRNVCVVYRDRWATRFYASQTLHLTWKFLLYTRKVHRTILLPAIRAIGSSPACLLRKGASFCPLLTFAPRFLCLFPLPQREYFQRELPHQRQCWLFNVKAAPLQRLLIFFIYYIAACYLFFT